jgi:glutathione S-transferase
LWQIRIHTHLLGSDGDEKTVARYRGKFASEVEPQLRERLSVHPFICSFGFSAADCVVGANVNWARAMPENG